MINTEEPAASALKQRLQAYEEQPAKKNRKRADEQNDRLSPWTFTLGSYVLESLAPAREKNKPIRAAGYRQLKSPYA
jgi:hypothetical protein